MQRMALVDTGGDDDDRVGNEYNGHRPGEEVCSPRDTSNFGQRPEKEMTTRAGRRTR